MTPTVERFPYMLPLVRALLVLIGVLCVAILGVELARRGTRRGGRATPWGRSVPRARALRRSWWVRLIWSRGP